MEETTMLYRPAGPQELDLIRESEFKEFPPRLPEQLISDFGLGISIPSSQFAVRIFYPVLNEEYVTQIARDWNIE